MTTQASIPAKWFVPFANGDVSRVELPVTTADPTRASQSLGFPPLTMQPPESGGVPPQGEDFNGGMNQIARVAWWVLNGGGWPFDAAFAGNANINGYPNGATLQSADFRGDWINTVDGNQNNPDTLGTNWVPGYQYGVTTLSGLTGGTVTPTPAQAAKRRIILAGTLGSALTVVLPTWLKDWTIVNNTTGAFVTIVKTAAGSGVTIPQNAAPTPITGDGTNIIQETPNVSGGTSTTQVAQIGQLRPNIQVFTASGTFNRVAGYNFYKVTVVGGGGGGGGANSTATTTSAAGGGGGGAATAVGIVDLTSTASVSVTIGSGGSGGVGGGAAPGAGNTSSFGTFVTANGGGAATNTSNIIAFLSGAGSSTTGGTAAQFAIPGSPGFYGGGTGNVSAAGGIGGMSAFGACTNAPAVNTVTSAGNGTAGANGAGGSGAAANNANATAGAGGNGIVIVEW